MLKKLFKITSGRDGFYRGGALPISVISNPENEVHSIYPGDNIQKISERNKKKAESPRVLG